MNTAVRTSETWGPDAGLELALRRLPGVVGVSTDDGDDLRVLVRSEEQGAAGGVEELVAARSPGTEINVIESGHFDEAGASPFAEEGSAPGERVALERVLCDEERGSVEIQLSLAGLTATGVGQGGSILGGAAATLSALGELGLRIPFDLVAADHLGSAPDAPVVVCLRPQPDGEERIGVARGSDDCEASARATLSALNRHLSDYLADGPRG